MMSQAKIFLTYNDKLNKLNVSMTTIKNSMVDKMRNPDRKISI